MYKKLIDPITKQDSTEQIKRLVDGAFIPFDEANTDYQEYLKWLDGYEKDEMGEFVKVSEGNTPEPADEV